MLIKLSDKEIAAFARIIRSDDGKIVLGYLQRGLDQTKNLLVMADAEPTIRRFQGRADALKDLAEALETAPDLIRKLEDRANGR